MLISGTVQSRRSAFAARIGHAVPAGMLGGVAFGIGIRIAMRIAAVMGGQDPEFSIPGTVAILVIGVILGAAFGPVAVVVGGIWRGRPVLGAALVGAGLALSFVVLVGGSEIVDIGVPAVNVLTFGASGAALGATAAWRVASRAEGVAGAGVGAVLVGTVAATAVVSALTTPPIAWIMDRLDGGTAVHPALPTLRDPRIESLGDIVGGALGALLGGVFVGMALAGVLILARRWVTASGRPVLAIGAIIAVLGGLTLLIPDGPRTTGNTAVIAVGIVVTAAAISSLVVRISRWFQPDLWRAPTSP